MQSVVNRYNAFGNFGNYNVWVYYNAGIPTAQANYLGSIGFGGTYPNERVTMHELAHYLGSGTYGTPWDGGYSEALVDQFDGLEATLNGDAWHFWPYGLNYDSEGSEINKQRQVALMYAQRADMGIGPSCPSLRRHERSVDGQQSQRRVRLQLQRSVERWLLRPWQRQTISRATSRSAPQPARIASTSLAARSPSTTPPARQGLYYTGTGTNGVITINDLRLNGGWIQHVSGWHRPLSARRQHRCDIACEHPGQAGPYRHPGQHSWRRFADHPSERRTLCRAICGRPTTVSPAIW